MRALMMWLALQLIGVGGGSLAAADDLPLPHALRSVSATAVSPRPLSSSEPSATVAAAPAVLQALTWMGRGHRALVHVPLGALVVAVLLECWALRGAGANPWRIAVTAVLVITVVGCIVAIASGLSRDSSDPRHEAHELAGWITAVLSALAAGWSWRTHRADRGRWIATGFIVAAVIAACVTGHLGSGIAHPDETWPW